MPWSERPPSYHTCCSGPSLSVPLLFGLPRPDKSGSYSGVPGTSPANCSRDFLAVSGTSDDVNTPSNMKTANISRTCGSQGVASGPFAPGSAPFVAKGPMITWAMTAPSFPEAALIPCDVLLYRVGKHSPGIINVVAFGPVSGVSQPSSLPVQLTEVEEELCNDMQRKLSRSSQALVCKAKNCEENGQDSKTPDLNWLPPDSIAEKGSEPVTRDSPSTHYYQVFPPRCYRTSDKHYASRCPCIQWIPEGGLCSGSDRSKPHQVKTRTRQYR